MNRRNNSGNGSDGGGDRGGKLDLKLHLSPPRAQIPIAESPNQSITTSPTSSCLSSELVFDETSLRYSSSPEATSMMLVGCPRCLMYIMLAKDYPKCPKCKSTVLLDVVHANVKRTKKSRHRHTDQPATASLVSDLRPAKCSWLWLNKSPLSTAPSKF
ncbi:hypothetical protein E3N88_32882 [Mikania micrantha]|uniref:GIR1-like zinc ribbon domain-containing protein n=1 Tax=Mikania micrantha TaxID=192012 RepID=A0A5N6MA85_9ASTR|nr:hypothetical protein E3N88_32882 [Mikania micrantha]